MRVHVAGCGCCGISEEETSHLSSLIQREEVRFSWFPQLCSSPDVLGRAVSSATVNVVLLAGRDVEARGRILIELYKIGVYPLNIEMINVFRLCRGASHFQKLQDYVTLALAGADDLRPFGAAHLRPTGTLDGALTRRSLLTLMRERYYDALPLLRSDKCAAPRQCNLCAQACPSGAISVDGYPSIDAQVCTSCGVCIAECPLDAWTSPALGVERLLKKVAGWLRASSFLQRTLILGCRGTLPLGERFLERDEEALFLEVTCLRSLTALDILKILSLGPLKLRMLTQPETCQAIHACDGTLPAASSARRALTASEYGGRLEVIPDVAETASRVEVMGPLVPLPRAITEAGNLQEAVTLLLPNQERVLLGGPGAGTIEIDDAKCTFCSVCSKRCPTTALQIEEIDGMIALTFEHNACTGCRVCEALCPEGAIQVRWMVDRRLLRGPVHVAEDKFVRCQNCGGNIAPSSMVRAMNQRVALPDVMWTLCSSCRTFPGIPQDSTS